jgi:hypothetical protein
MSGWIFARGRAAERTLADVAPTGARRLPLADADQSFAAGDLIVVSEADGTETQWLGLAAGADATGLDVTRPLTASKNSGARVWKAVAWLPSSAAAAFPLRRAIRTGVMAHRARDGGVVAVQTAPPLDEFSLTFTDLTPAAEAALLLWLEGQAGWGLTPFTLIEPGGALLAAQLASGNELPVRLERDAGGRRRLTLDMWVVTGEEWQ